MEMQLAFCMLILYPGKFIQFFFIISNIFLVEYLGFS